MTRFLVTGGCGFIGSHLVESLLAQGAKVRVLDDLSVGDRSRCPPSAELVVGDVADPATTMRAMADVDGCFHLAAVASVQRSVEAWTECSRTNIGGTIAVLDAARGGGGERPVPVVYASSAAIYGDSDLLPLSENAPVRPGSPYAADKAACELQARAAWGAFGVPSVGLRLFNIYGPRQDPASPYSGVISRFVDRVSRAEPVEVFGDGEQSRDFVYVGDVVDILGAVMTRMGQGAMLYNLCTGAMRSLNQLIEIVGREAGGHPERITLERRRGDIMMSCGDPSRLAQDFGLRATTDLETGIGALMRTAHPQAAE